MSGNGMFAVMALLPIAFYVVLIFFGIYFVIKAVKYMDAKIKLDREKNEKIDRLIEAINKEKNH
ncbi:hypothetical protein D1B33_14870 [Lysinibacillus yapensis]|uniref:DUF4083 domain-containing protein n=1 Tax=Ureibacillus yapensis TaxID=2304605 RepID=A0A396SJQ1_9BACL|nr:hypothetical protein [Lysinibacillus yapensis]RHW34077.1 hypothetical protein D1B33_14870 [Lysinibacillus yapensis]